MPIRLDFVLWGASFVFELGRRYRNAPRDAKYVHMKYTTWAIDYCYMFAMLCFIETYVSTHFTPLTIFVVQAANSCLVVAVDILKAVLFADLLPKAKIEHLKHLGQSLREAVFTVQGIKGNFGFLGKLIGGQGILLDWEASPAIVRTSARHNLWYFVKIGLGWIPAASALYVYVDFWTCEPLNEAILVLGEGEWYECHVSRFLKVYLEFMIMAAIKDTISMNLAHQMFHSHPWLMKLHKTHHLPRRELTVANAFYFDVPDLIVEDGIGPLMLIMLKSVLGGVASVHYASFYLCVVCDQTVHSVDPYTCMFWNPLLDNLMRGALSHNLHHAVNKGHYTIWPEHHFKGVASAGHKADVKATDGFDVDVREYNKIFETDFPEDL